MSNGQPHEGKLYSFPPRHEIAMNQAKALAALGQWEEADKVFDSAMENSSHDILIQAQLLYDWSLVLLTKGDLQIAFNHLHEAQKRLYIFNESDFGDDQDQVQNLLLVVEETMDEVIKVDKIIDASGTDD